MSPIQMMTQFCNSDIDDPESFKSSVHLTAPTGIYHNLYVLERFLTISVLVSEIFQKIKGDWPCEPLKNMEIRLDGKINKLECPKHNECKKNKIKISSACLLDCNNFLQLSESRNYRAYIGKRH